MLPRISVEDLLIKNDDSSSLIQPLIIGGEEASPGEFPYQISVQRQSGTTSRFSHFCGGSIYDGRTIITAAQCVDGYIEILYLAATHNSIYYHFFNIYKADSKQFADYC